MKFCMLYIVQSSSVNQVNFTNIHLVLYLWSSTFSEKKKYSMFNLEAKYYNQLYKYCFLVQMEATLSMLVWGKYSLVLTWIIILIFLVRLSMEGDWVESLTFPSGPPPPCCGHFYFLDRSCKIIRYKYGWHKYGDYNESYKKAWLSSKSPFLALFWSVSQSGWNSAWHCQVRVLRWSGRPGARSWEPQKLKKVHRSVCWYVSRVLGR